YVHLVRKDTARQALSWYRAITSNEWFRFSDDDPVVNETLPDLQQVRWLEDLILDHQQKWENFFTSGRISPLRVEFDELVTYPKRTVRRTFDYIGVAYSEDQDFRPGQ